MNSINGSSYKYNNIIDSEYEIKFSGNQLKQSLLWIKTMKYDFKCNRNREGIDNIYSVYMCANL